MHRTSGHGQPATELIKNNCLIKDMIKNIKQGSLIHICDLPTNKVYIQQEKGPMSTMLISKLINRHRETASKHLYNLKGQGSISNFKKCIRQQNNIIFNEWRLNER